MFLNDIKTSNLFLINQFVEKLVLMWMFKKIWMSLQISIRKFWIKKFINIFCETNTSFFKITFVEKLFTIWNFALKLIVISILLILNFFLMIWPKRLNWIKTISLIFTILSFIFRMGNENAILIILISDENLCKNFQFMMFIELSLFIQIFVLDLSWNWVLQIAYLKPLNT